jgi:short-subunit dehydrogenase
MKIRLQNDLIITARNHPRLEEIAGELQGRHGNRVHVVPADLARPESPQTIFDEVMRRGLRARSWCSVLLHMRG